MSAVLTFNNFLERVRRLHVYSRHGKVRSKDPLQRTLNLPSQPAKKIKNNRTSAPFPDDGVSAFDLAPLVTPSNLLSKALDPENMPSDQGCPTGADDPALIAT